MKRAAVAPYSSSFTVFVFNTFSTRFNAQNRPLSWDINQNPSLLFWELHRRERLHEGFASSSILYTDAVLFIFFFYRRYRRFTWAKPLRKASHVHGRGYDSDAAESQTIALVQGSAADQSQPIHPPHTHSHKTHIKDHLSCSPCCFKCVRTLMMAGKEMYILCLLMCVF